MTPLFLVKSESPCPIFICHRMDSWKYNIIALNDLNPY